MTSIRMCIKCKVRKEQYSMHRFQLKNKKICQYNNIGRSFYICETCFENTKLNKFFKKYFKIEVDCEGVIN